MIRTNYHINELHANLNPNTEELEFIYLSIELEYGDATVDTDRNMFATDATVDLELYSPEDFEDDDESGEPSFGDITIELTLTYEHEEGMLGDLDIEEQKNVWNSEGVKHVDSQLLSQMESGLISQIFAPLEHLFRDSFRGFLPSYRFTTTEEEEEEANQEEVDVDQT